MCEVVAGGVGLPGRAARRCAASCAAGRRRRLGARPGGRGGFGGPRQALQPRVFCKPDFEIDPTSSDGASARLEFSEKKSRICLVIAAVLVGEPLPYVQRPDIKHYYRLPAQLVPYR